MEEENRYLKKKFNNSALKWHLLHVCNIAVSKITKTSQWLYELAITLLKISQGHFHF